MKRLLSRFTKGIAALAIVASVFGPGTQTPTAYAETGQTPASYDAPGTSGASPASQGWGANTNSAVTANTNGAYNSNSSSGGDTDLQCSATSGTGLALCVSGFVYWITVGIGSWVANITAYVFDYAVMLSLTGAAYALDVIAIGWGIVRDVANMSFLFILVYISFKIMFQAETAGTIRMLVWVVVIALLVNFSFVMTRVVIDAGNIVALQFYNSIASGSPYINEDAKTTNGGVPVKDITSSIMYALNPQDIIGSGAQFKNYVANKGNSAMYLLIVSSVIYILTGICLFMIAAIFIFAAVRFVLRVIGLAGIIIVAPAAFVAAIFRGKEGGAKWFNKWLGYLLEYTFYPAIFLFLFYIEIRFMQEMGGARLFNGVFNAAGADGQNLKAIAQASANVAVRLAYILASMYLVLRASTWTSEAFNRVGTNWVQGKVFGLGRGALKLGGAGAARLSGLAYQQTVGRGAAAASSAVAQRGGGSSWLGYRVRQGLQNISRTGVGGTRSFNQFKDAREKETTERNAIRERAERRGAVQDLLGAKGQESTQASSEAYGASRQAAAEGIFRAAARENEARSQQTSGTNRPVSNIGAARVNQPGAGGAAGSQSSFETGGASVGKIMNELNNMKAEAEKTARTETAAVILTATPTLGTIVAPASGPTKAPAQNSSEMRELRDAISSLRANNKTAQGTTQNVTYTMAPQTHALKPTSISVDYDKMKGVVKQVVRKELEHFEPTAPHEPTPPSPAAPAAMRPQVSQNDNNPPPNPGLGGMKPLPKAA